MSSAGSRRLRAMSNLTQAPTTLSNIGVAMFTVADQDAALAFYTEKLGFELRSDTRFGENGEMRWLEVAPPGSAARLALNPPMGDQPGGSGIGVETTDVLAEHARLSAIGGIDVDPEPMRTPGRPAAVHAARPGRQPHRRGRGSPDRLGPPDASGSRLVPGRGRPRPGARYPRGRPGLAWRQPAGSLERSEKTGAMTLPGATSWTWPSRWPQLVRHRRAQEVPVRAHAGRRRPAAAAEADDAARVAARRGGQVVRAQRRVERDPGVAVGRQAGRHRPLRAEADPAPAGHGAPVATADRGGRPQCFRDGARGRGAGRRVGRGGRGRRADAARGGDPGEEHGGDERPRAGIP